MTECFTCLWISKGIRCSPGALTWSLWQLLWQSLPTVTQICYFPLIFPRCRGHNNLCYRAAAKSIWSCQSLYSHAPQSLCFCSHAGAPLRTCASIYVVVRHLPLLLLKHNSAILTEIKCQSHKSVFTPSLYTSWKSFSGSTLFPSISWNKIL